MGNVVLRFTAKFVQSSEENSNRRFVVAFYLGDDSCCIYELRERNSGCTGGKYLEKGCYKNALACDISGNLRNFVETDFQIGQPVKISFHPRSSACSEEFLLLDKDTFTRNYRRSKGVKSPRSRLEAILHKYFI